MKIKITYQQGEPMSAVVKALSPLFPHSKWSFSDRYAPYFHAYLNVTTNDEMNNKQRENPPRSKIRRE